MFKDIWPVSWTALALDHVTCPDRLIDIWLKSTLLGTCLIMKRVACCRSFMKKVLFVVHKLHFSTGQLSEAQE